LNSRKPRCLTNVRILLAVVAIVLATPVGAQALRYRLEIEAPRELARTLKQGLSLARWQNDPQMSAEQLKRLAQDAVREAREVAATEGYFSAQVDLTIDESAPEWTVRLKVDPGVRTRVSQVDIRFTGPAERDPEARDAFKRVRDTWRLRRGQPFRQAEWDAAKREAVRELSSWRYAAARIADSKAEIHPETREAHLTIELASGPAFRFGPLRLSGMRRFPDALAQNLSPIREGETYERDKVLLYQRRLLETNYFASVQADIDVDPLLADSAPLRVAVIESSTQHFEAGVGYSTDSGPRVEARYSNQDIYESAWRFKTGFRVDEKQQQVQIDFDSPPRPGARWQNLFARARGTDIQNEVTQEFAIGASQNWYSGMAPLAIIVSGHLEEQRVRGDPDVIDNRHAIYFGHRRSFRNTDDYILPRAGYLGTVEVGGSPWRLASEQFLRVIGGVSLLYPLTRRGDFLLRTQGGTVFADSREGIPSTFLFRTGGDQTVRGYAFESIGVEQGAAIVGGRRLLVASAEYTQWIGEGWGIAGFVDAGDAWDDGLNFNPAFGYGIGGRFRTPIGPIRGDLAYGERTNQFRIHFSVGYTF
jgi:translocation and assembly module TamA